jgi:hypothetical protein
MYTVVVKVGRTKATCSLAAVCLLWHSSQSWRPPVSHWRFKTASIVSWEKYTHVLIVIGTTQRIIISCGLNRFQRHILQGINITPRNALTQQQKHVSICKFFKPGSLYKMSTTFSSSNFSQWQNICRLWTRLSTTFPGGRIFVDSWRELSDLLTYYTEIWEWKTIQNKVTALFL